MKIRQNLLLRFLSMVHRIISNSHFHLYINFVIINAESPDTQSLIYANRNILKEQSDLIID